MTPTCVSQMKCLSLARGLTQQQADAAKARAEWTLVQVRVFLTPMEEFLEEFRRLPLSWLTTNTASFPACRVSSYVCRWKPLRFPGKVGNTAQTEERKRCHLDLGLHPTSGAR